jgi:hypothetical protein
MNIRKIIAATALAFAAASGAGMAVAVTTAPSASATDLVNYDGGSISLGRHLILGVWYQQSSGGPSGYWAGVWSYPAHRWIFIRSGHATSSGWTTWLVKPSQRGKYATVYDVTVAKTTFYTTVR